MLCKVDRNNAEQAITNQEQEQGSSSEHTFSSNPSTVTPEEKKSQFESSIEGSKGKASKDSDID